MSQAYSDPPNVQPERPCDRCLLAFSPEDLTERRGRVLCAECASPEPSALFKATALNARACAKASVHVTDGVCGVCPQGLSAFLDASIFEVCDAGQEIKTWIAQSETAIADAVRQPMRREAIQ